jgi:hypothetical protein
LAPDSISTHSPDFSQESRFSAFRKIWESDRFVWVFNWASLILR